MEAARPTRAPPVRGGLGSGGDALPRRQRLGQHRPCLLGEAPPPACQLLPLTFQRGRKMEAKEMENTSYTPI